MQKMFKSNRAYLTAGIDLAGRMINAKDMSAIKGYADDANSKDYQTRNNAISVLVGIGSTFSELISELGSKGIIKITGDPLPTLEEMIRSASSDRGLFSKQLQVQINTMDKVFAARPDISVRARKKDQSKTAEDVVQTVRIESMPTRVVKTSLSHDSEGNLVSVSQVEMDA